MGCVLAELHAQGWAWGGEGLPPKASRAAPESQPGRSVLPHPSPCSPSPPDVAGRGRTLQESPEWPLTPCSESGGQHMQKEATCHCQPSLGRQASGLTRAPEFLAPDLPLDIAGVIYGDHSLWHEVFSGDFYGRNYGKML